MKITKEEKIQIVMDRISTEITDGGGSGYKSAVSLRKLAEYLIQIETKREKEQCSIDDMPKEIIKPLGL